MQPDRPGAAPRPATAGPVVLSRVAAVVGLLQTLVLMITLGATVTSYLQGLHNIGVSADRRIGDAELTAGRQAVATWFVVWCASLLCQFVADVPVITRCVRLRRTLPPPLRGNTGVIIWLSIIASPVLAVLGGITALTFWASMNPDIVGDLSAVLAALGPTVGWATLTLGLLGAPVIRVVQLFLRPVPRKTPPVERMA